MARSEEEVDATRKLIRWNAREHHIEVRLSNLGATPKQVEVKERIPVSEVDKVAIDHDEKHTTAGSEPDGDGFVVWNVSLAPFGHETLELRYTMKWRQGVVGA